MTSFTQPEITDPAIQAAISAHRRAPGVHVYLDVPHDDQLKGCEFDTAIADLSLMRPQALTHTYLARILAEDAIFAVGLQNQSKSVVTEAGFKKGNAYGSIYNRGKWHEYSSDKTITLKAGDFAIFSTEFVYPPDIDKDAPVTYMFQGGQGVAKTSFHYTEDLKQLNRMFYHGATFEKVEILEHHFLYGGITAALPKDPDNKITNFGPKVDQLLSLSAGGWAVITGSYTQIDPKTDGILAGYYRGKNKTLGDVTFKGYKSGDEAVVRIKLSPFGIHFQTEEQKAPPKSEAINDEWIDLRLQNIDIKHIEIHTGNKTMECTP